MRPVLWAIVVAGAAGLGGCGAPRQAGVLAAQYGALMTVPAEDAAVRAQLVDQDAAWQTLAGLLQQRVLGGVSVNPAFVAEVNATAALAKREHALIAGGQDDPALNRQALEKFHAAWQAANRYLNP